MVRREQQLLTNDANFLQMTTDGRHEEASRTEGAGRMEMGMGWNGMSDMDRWLERSIIMAVTMLEYSRREKHSLDGTIGGPVRIEKGMIAHVGNMSNSLCQ